jgi:molybdopterin-containing oxidoreductase family molybdopterin binding subunit
MVSEKTKTGISRRGFLTTMAVAAGTTALAGSFTGCATKKTTGTEEPLALDETVFRGACRGNCASSCVLNVTVRDGKIVKTEPTPMDNPDDTRICARGHAHPQRVYAADRLKYPMRRVEGTARGAGEWEQISWDEAITYIADKWKGYREEFGDSSIAYVYGTGNLALDPQYIMRLFNTMHATSVTYTVDYSYCYYMGPKAVGYGPWFFGSDPKTMTAAKNIFVWGANPSHSLATSWPYLQNALDAGARLTVIDPQFTVAASKANHYVRIRPGTDAVLAMAMINIVVAEGLQDDDYMRKGTVAPFLVKEADGLYLRMSDLGVEPQEGPVSPSTGKPTVIDPLVVRAEDGSVGAVEEIADPVLRGTYTIEGHKVTTAYDLLLERCSEWLPERASAICDIPVDTIYELAHTFVDGPTTIYLNMGVDHLSNGASGYHAMFALSFITGQIGSPGNGFNGGASFNMSSGVINSKPRYPDGATPGPSIVSPRFPEVMRTGKYGDMPISIKSLYFTICNPLVTATGRQEWLKALDQVELIVVTDVLLSDTARYADIILPVPHYFEKWDVSYNVTPCVTVNEKAIEPLYDCKSDFEIANLLAEALGLGEQVVMSFDDYITASLDTEKSQSIGLSWETLKEKKSVYSAVDGFCLGQNYSFSTPTGRAQFYLEKVQPISNYGQIATGEFDPRREALPNWKPPVEAWHENPLHEKYPLQIMTWRSRYKTHTQFTHCQWLLEVWPEPYLYLNADDAAARGIKTGDTIKAYNDRGHMVCKAVSSAGISPGTVLQDHGWTLDQFIEGSLSDLLANHTDPASCQESWYDCLCQVEKV